MTDEYPKTAFFVDDGIGTAIFKYSGSGGCSPNRPVCATGTFWVQQIVCIASKYIGVVAHSGAQGDPTTVYMRGTVKVYITGAAEAGDPLEATGSATAAAFKVPTSLVAAVSGVAATGSAGVGKFYPSGVRIAGYALQQGDDGDLILVKLV